MNFSWIGIPQPRAEKFPGVQLGGIPLYKSQSWGISLYDFPHGGILYNCIDQNFIIPDTSVLYLCPKSEIITMIVNILPNGMIEIPVEYREKFGIESGKKVSLEYDYEHKGLLLRPITKEKLEGHTSKLLADEDKILLKRAEIVNKNILGK